MSVVPKRINIGWGAISMVDAMVEMYRYALSSGEYERFILLSGEDYPIQSNDAIYDALSDNSIEHIRALRHPFSQQYTDYWVWRRYSKYFCGALRRILRYMGFSKELYIRIGNDTWPIYKASQWSALSRGCIIHVLSVYDRYPCIRSYFKYSHAPDESLIPTIIMNTPEYSGATLTMEDEDNTDFNQRPVLHYLKYMPQRGSTVKIFDESAYEHIITSGKLFVRKMRPGTSDKLIEMLNMRRNK